MMALQQIEFGFVLKPKSRMYDESYLSSSLTRVIIKGEEGPHCVLSLSLLVAERMKPFKLKRYLETKHSEMKNKPGGYLHRKLDEIRIQQKFS
jgi:hypothetical protein